MDYVDQVDLLLRYLPLCETEVDKESIMYEVRRLRHQIVRIEEMTMTERNRDVKTMKVELEADFDEPDYDLRKYY